MRPIASYYVACIEAAKKKIEDEMNTTSESDDMNHVVLDALAYFNDAIAKTPGLRPWSEYELDNIRPVDDRHWGRLTPRQLAEAIIGAKEVRIGMSDIESESVALVDYTISDKAIILKYTTQAGANCVAEICAEEMIATVPSGEHYAVVSRGASLWGSTEDIALFIYTYALAPKAVWRRPPCPAVQA